MPRSTQLRNRSTFRNPSRLPRYVTRLGHAFLVALCVYRRRGLESLETAACHPGSPRLPPIFRSTAHCPRPLTLSPSHWTATLADRSYIDTMMANNNRSNVKKACLVALVASGASLAGADSSTRKLKAACRGEEVCLNQVCDPTSFQYNVGSEGSEFPYTVSHTLRGGQVEFKVCPSSSAADACKRGSGGCSGLTSFKLRMRNDGLSMGRDLISEPNGRMWASCSSHGPGHEWTDGELRSLASGPDQADCETFTVATAGRKKPSLADICQQKVKIVENSGWTVVDTAAKPDSCLVTLVTSNGRVGYAVVGGDKVSPKEEKEEKEERADAVKPASVANPASYGSRAGVSGYGSRVGVAGYGQRAGVSSYGSRRRGLKREFGLGGRRMF